MSVATVTNIRYGPPLPPSPPVPLSLSYNHTLVVSYASPSEIGSILFSLPSSNGHYQDHDRHHLNRITRKMKCCFSPSRPPCPLRTLHNLHTLPFLETICPLFFHQRIPRKMNCCASVWHISHSVSSTPLVLSA